jgi:acetylornithine deacetylase/succinyl-diaminopimelate desuccinylase-like protein
MRRHSVAQLVFAIVVAAGLCVSRAAAAAAPDQVPRVRADSKVRAAMTELARTHDQLVADTIALTEIAAPPFHEQARAAAFAALLTRAGLTGVERDAQGNVLALRRGRLGSRAPLIVIAAHLDTVFPAGTDVHVAREGTRLSAPGVGDNARSLAVLAAIARALTAASIATSADVLFVGNVGEEGAGDLSGVRYLFTKGAYRERIGAFIAVDGAGPGSEVVDTGLGVRRYHVVFNGPGGHSYGAFGIVNPAYALANAIERLSRIVPAAPRTTFNVGVIGGGTSVNAIPSEAWTDIDLRSVSTTALDQLERQFTAAMRDAAAEENRTRSTALGRVSVALSLTGSRPGGRTPTGSALVAAADAVIRAAGLSPTHSAASTDANLPMSLGIPAIAVASGGAGDRAHTRDEWIDVDPPASLRGVGIVLTLLLTVAGLP